MVWMYGEAKDVYAYPRRSCTLLAHDPLLILRPRPIPLLLVHVVEPSIRAGFAQTRVLIRHDGLAEVRGQLFQTLLLRLWIKEIDHQNRDDGQTSEENEVAPSDIRYCCGAGGYVCLYIHQQ